MDTGKNNGVAAPADNARVNNLSPFQKQINKSLLIKVSVLLLFLTIFYESCKLPQISGYIFDMDTGRPLVGAYVEAIYVGPSMSLSSGKSMAIGGGGTNKSDQNGYFNFSSSFFPYPKETIFLLVYSMDHIPCFSTGKGFDETLVFTEHKEVKREGNRFKGYRYTIKLKKVESESQWRERVETVIRIAMNNMGKKNVEEWQFNDIVDYLERFPHGEKAADYFFEFLRSQPYDCETLREYLKNGDLKRSQLPILNERNNKIIELSDQVDLPTDPIRAKCVRDIIQSKIEAKGCFEALINEK